MKFNLSEAMEVLERTPAVLHTLLNGLCDGWTTGNEGADTWCAYDVMGHLIHGERKDWMERLGIIMSDKAERKFHPFDRFAQFEESKGKTLADLLGEFSAMRKVNLEMLRELNLQEADLNRTGIHPAFGEVTLRQLLATWASHDLSHINQITRVMAKQYKEEIGPWVEYMNIMKDRNKM